MTSTLTAADGRSVPIPTTLRSKIVAPDDAGYWFSRSTYVAHGKPAGILRASGPDDVAAALDLARNHSLPLAVRSGGHGLGGLSTNDGGLVIDLRPMNDIDIVDARMRRVSIGAGATWAEVAQAIHPVGWSISSGNNGDVGVRGIATNGGIGYLARSQGLTIDRVRSVDLVTADGGLRVVDRTEPDLFWAVRGGGAAVGVVTRVEVEAEPVPDVVYTEAMHDLRDVSSFAQTWAARLAGAPRELTSFANLMPGTSGRPPVSRTQLVWAGTDADAAAEAVGAVVGAAPLLGVRSSPTPYPALVPGSGQPHVAQQSLVFRNGFLRGVDHHDAAAIAALLDSPADVLIELRSVDGAVDDTSVDATAFAHRDATVFVAVWGDTRQRDRLDADWGRMATRLHGSYGAYTSATDAAARELAYPGETGRRLARLADRFDPGRLFASSSLIPYSTGALPPSLRQEST